MKKVVTLALVICSSLLLSACVPQKEIQNTASVTPTSSLVEEKTTFSLRELLAKNIAQKCTWKTSMEDGSGQGEIIISGNKFKQTIKVNGPEGETEFIALSDGEWFYTWSNNSATDNTALKMKMNQLQDSDKNSQNQPVNEQLNLDENLNYNCQTAVINEADLSVPKNIQFIDFTEFTKQFQQ